MISFKVIEKCWQDAKDYKGTECDFYLEESNWDDYGYQTTYCLHATKKLTGLKDNIYLGIVHIPADTRSAFPVISVQSPVSIQCCWQS